MRSMSFPQIVLDSLRAMWTNRPFSLSTSMPAVASVFMPIP